jgi:hypothetical protein
LATVGEPAGEAVAGREKLGGVAAEFAAVGSEELAAEMRIARGAAEGILAEVDFARLAEKIVVGECEGEDAIAGDANAAGGIGKRPRIWWRAGSSICRRSGCPGVMATGVVARWPGWPQLL